MRVHTWVRELSILKTKSVHNEIAWKIDARLTKCVNCCNQLLGFRYFRRTSTIVLAKTGPCIPSQAVLWESFYLLCKFSLPNLNALIFFLSITFLLLARSMYYKLEKPLADSKINLLFLLLAEVQLEIINRFRSVVCRKQRRKIKISICVKC